MVGTRAIVSPAPRHAPTCALSAGMLRTTGTAVGMDGFPPARGSVIAGAGSPASAIPRSCRWGQPAHCARMGRETLVYRLDAQETPHAPCPAIQAGRQYC